MVIILSKLNWPPNTALIPEACLAAIPSFKAPHLPIRVYPFLPELKLCSGCRQIQIPIWFLLKSDCMSDCPHCVQIDSGSVQTCPHYWPMKQVAVATTSVASVIQCMYRLMLYNFDRDTCNTCLCTPRLIWNDFPPLSIDSCCFFLILLLLLRYSSTPPMVPSALANWL